MTSTRQLRKTGTDLERMLLAAGAAERPDAASVRKAAKLLGVVPRAALIAATLGIALRATRWSSVAAWSAVPLVGVAGVALVAHRAAAPPAQGATSVAAAPLATQVPLSHRVPELQEPPAAVEPQSARVARPAAAVPPRLSMRKAAIAGAPVDGLREQADALDGARELLSLGEPHGALSRLDDFDRRFAGGPLHEEAQLLRIEALARKGDRTAATALARRFLKTHPESVHVDRVASILQSLTP
jgi:hypothetical protein